MKNSMRFALSVVLFAVLSALGQAEEAGLREFLSNYVKAFNEHDLKAVSAMWAADASHTDRDTGERTEGRDAITDDLVESFKASPEAQLAGRIDRVRMVKPDVASVEGQTTFLAPGAEPSVSNFNAILVKEDGRWVIDSIEESEVPQPTTSYDALKELAWLVGRWVDDGEGVRVDTTFRWTANNAFLLRSFVVQTPEGVEQQGTQIIGWDPRSREIRSWSFNSDGSFGDGAWTKSGEQWFIKSTQTLADGDAASGTYVLTRVDDDTITLKLIGREVEGEPRPATEAVTVVRVADVVGEGSDTEDTNAENKKAGDKNSEENEDKDDDDGQHDDE